MNVFKRTQKIILPALIAVSIMLVAPSAAAYAQDETPGGEPISFDIASAIDYAIEHNPTYRRAVIALTMAELDFDYNAAIFEPAFKAEFDASHTRTGGLSYESQVLSGTDSKKIDAQFSYSRLLPAGDSFSLSFGSNRSVYSSAFLGEGSEFIRSYTSMLGLTYSRPLMKGFGSSVTTAGIRRATLDAAISDAALELAELELVYSVRIAYLLVLTAHEALDVAEASLAEAESLYEETKAKVAVGTLAPYQEIAAEAGLYSRREELLRAQGEYEKSLNGLKEILGIDFATPIDIEFDFTMPEIEPDAGAAVDRALELRPEVHQLKLRRTRAEIDLNVARNSIRPELGFSGGCGYQGEDFDFGGSLSEMDNFSWFAGLVYAIPIGGNRAANAQMNMAELAIQDIDLQLRGVEDGIRRAVLNAIIEYENARERYDVAGAGLEAAQAKMDSERRRFELGLITAGDLLEYEREFTNARFAKINAHLEYMGAAALLAKLTNAG